MGGRPPQLTVLCPHRLIKLKQRGHFAEHWFRSVGVVLITAILLSAGSPWRHIRSGWNRARTRNLPLYAPLSVRFRIVGSLVMCSNRAGGIISVSSSNCFFCWLQRLIMCRKPVLIQQRSTLPFVSFRFFFVAASLFLYGFRSDHHHHYHHILLSAGCEVRL